jgi:hypothetical protein
MTAPGRKTAMGAVLAALIAMLATLPALAGQVGRPVGDLGLIFLASSIGLTAGTALAAREQLSGVVAEWVDFSEAGDGETKCPGESLAQQYEQMMNGSTPVASASASDSGKRFFGKGDVLRNASLEFGEKSVVEIESRFENCSIALGTGAVLKLGKHGVLQGCQVVGFGEIVIDGEFKENGKAPGFVGPKRLVVGKHGVVTGSVQQPPGSTEFGFEKGCVLRLKIQK